MLASLMALAPGFRLGPYEILAPIGAGGMGEVYRARDARLGRDVAIKVLPSRLSDDPQALARFEREARAVAALSHPGILAIHDFATSDGIAFAAMELLEGATLRDTLNPRLPLRRALDYAVQMAEALAAAHDKGVVHRDLKPTNVFVTRAGRIKILDFGLAKQRPDPAESASTEPLDSDPGVIRGTAGYMSPEQARGDELDHRSDIFAFGAVLYEMISGVRAFKGATASETREAILHQDPPEWPSDCPVPAAVDRIVRHCLEKHPDQRFQSTRDLAFDLSTLSLTPTSAERPAPVARRWGRLAVALVLAAALFGLGRATGGRREGPPPSFRRVTFQRGDVLSARFAPDGHTIAYGAAWEGEPAEIFSGRIDNPESRALGFRNATVLAISSAGEMAVSLGQRPDGGTLARVPLAGGAPREVMENVRFADWSPDGKQLLVTRWQNGRNRIEYPVGTMIFEAAGWVENPRVAPSGDLVAFVDHPIRADTTGTLMIVGRGEPARALSGPWASIGGVAWSPDGREVWFTAARTGSARVLHAVDLEGRLRTVASVAGRLVLQDISRDGRVLASHPNLRSGMAGLVGGSATERNLSGLDYSRSAFLSADGSLLLYDEGGDASGDDYSVYLRRTDGSHPVRLGDGAAQALSPDGRFALALVAPRAELVVLPTRAGEARVLPLQGIVPQAGALWMPDGTSILFSGALPGRAVRSYLLPLDGSAPRPVTPEGMIVVTASPDGSVLGAVNTDHTFRLVPVTGGESRVVPGVDTRLDAPVAFTADGSSIYFFRGGQLPGRVEIVDAATGRRTPWRDLQPPDPAGVTAISRVQVAADGRSYVYTYRRILSDLFVIEGLR
jgi:Tol biopolymer transport system component